MRKPTFISFGHIAGIVGVPLALAVMAQPASAQWHAQQQQVPQQQRYPQQRYPQGRAGQQGSAGAREIFEWQGTVDKEVRVQMEGNRTAVMAIGNNERGLGRARATSGVPGQDGYVSVQTVEGRGRVDVVQQPSANNGYTTIVRVRDPQSGGAPYRIAAYWQPTGNYGAYGNTGNYGTYGNTGVYGGGQGNDRANGHQDRDDDRDQGYQGNDNGNHKDHGRHLGQRKHGRYDD